MNKTGLKWQNLPAQRFLEDEQLQRDWDGLNSERADLPFLAAYAVKAALRHFGGGDERLLVGTNDGRSCAMLLLHRCGAGRWQTFQPSQLPLGVWVAARGISPEGLAASLLRSALGPSLAVSITQVDPMFAPRQPSDPSIAVSDYIDTGWIDISGSFEEYWAQRGKNLRSNLRKQRNRLQSDGAITEFATFAHPDEMAPAIERYGALESSGWKAREGTAIHLTNEQGRFYRELLEAAADKHEATVVELRFGGKTVASNLCLKRRGRWVILKTTYDETVDKALSPALLLHSEHLERIFGDGESTRVEYYGRFMDWHSRFTDSKRTLHHLTVFRWSWLRSLRERLSRERTEPDTATRTPQPVADS